MLRRVFSFIGHLLLALLALMGHGLRWLGHFFVSLISRSRIALIAVVAVVVLLVGGLVDFGMNWGKAYAGVHIGELDVSGKSLEEIHDLVNETYQSRLANGNVIVYASDESASKVADEMAQAENVALAEQRSVEQAQANKELWTATAPSLGASLPTDELVAQALAVGREQGGFGARLAAFFGGWTVEVRAQYNPDALETLAADIDATIGNPRVDFGISVSSGTASVTDGHDGSMVDRATFEDALDRAFLSDSNGRGTFVARVDYAPLRIDHAAAQVVCDQVNASLTDGVRFIYKSATWSASASDIGAWVATRVEEADGAWRLVPYLEESHAKSSILTHVQQVDSGDSVKVSFERNGEDITVHTEGSGDIPLVAETVYALEMVLFGEADRIEYQASSQAGSEGTVGIDNTGNASALRPGLGQPVEVTVASGPAPTSSSFDEAFTLGLITDVASYTTSYTSGAGTENRNHNIHLVSDLLSKSIVKPGDTWSFNGVAGECNAKRGFLGAGAIIDGQYDDAVGGGICQVATTVFNAVYDSGYPVVTRHNHSLYMSSYPAGRDAAVSWPDLDLVWKNDGASDVLVLLTYTDSSVTVTLYGVNPGYRVSSNVGNWAEGAKYKTKVVTEESMASGTSYTKTAGTNGKSITVVRSVATSDGTVLHEDLFASTYDPVTEVIVAAPDVAAKLRDAEQS
ncbi:MAG: VanW family protein [Gordonibacter sp.]|nr:VanW family protein [Gordonibacter sp.]